VFLDQVIDRISVRSDVDTSRIFMVGESNGGMMVHRYLCGPRHRLAGAASVAGTSVADCPPIVSFPFIEIHGLDDVTVPAAGGSSENALVDGTTFAPVRQTVEAVAASAGCAPDAVTTAGGSIDVLTWSGCRDGASVRYVTLRNRGHEWPTAPVYPATTEILRFFGLAAA
jgi:polyhydroxybutyrate depolymerase